jgi:hypothetical protein
VDKRKEGVTRFLEVVFTILVFFGGALYVMHGPAANPRVFWFRTGLLVVGLVGLGIVKLRQR